MVAAIGNGASFRKDETLLHGLASYLGSIRRAEKRAS
jgi:hypothetical protein